MSYELANKIFNILPKTQCRKCGYPTCQEYAQAVAQGEQVGKCYPGGIITQQAITKLVGRNADFQHKPHNNKRKIAKIDENTCIGCNLCQDVCPTDAIIGAKPLLHTVLSQDCSGCTLCYDVCPVNCIALNDSNASANALSSQGKIDSEHFQEKFIAKNKRQAAKLTVSKNVKKHKKSAQSLLAQLKAKLKESEYEK